MFASLGVRGQAAVAAWVSVLVASGMVLAACHSKRGATQSAHDQASVDACSAPSSKGVRLVGRYDGCKPEGPRSSWSGSGFVARFTGTELSATLQGPALIFTTVIDGQIGNQLSTQDGTNTYVLARGLGMGEHTLELYRQGEASFGPSVLHAVSVTNGELLEPSAVGTRRIEIVGDSITAGYGNEGTSASCPFSAETENHYLTYGAILARTHQAELSTVAWSGKGVVSNYGGNRDTRMPELYDRAEPGDNNSLWDFSLWQPDAVIVNLGTNDYSTDNDPTDDEFTSEYERLLRTIRAHYPKAHIFCTVGPLLSGPDLQKAESNIATAVQRRVMASDTALTFHPMKIANTDPGCDWHPGLATHRAMAEDLGSVVSKTLGW